MALGYRAPYVAQPGTVRPRAAQSGPQRAWSSLTSPNASKMMATKKLAKIITTKTVYCARAQHVAHMSVVRLVVLPSHWSALSPGGAQAHRQSKQHCGNGDHASEGQKRVNRRVIACIHGGGSWCWDCAVEVARMVGWGRGMPQAGGREGGSLPHVRDQENKGRRSTPGVKGIAQGH